MVTRESARPASAEQRLEELGIRLPAPPEPFGTYFGSSADGQSSFSDRNASPRKAARRNSSGASVRNSTWTRAARRPISRRLTASLSHVSIWITRQSHEDRAARRVGSHFGRCPRSTESR